MPILGCIGLFIILYLFLSYKEKDNREPVESDNRCKNCNSIIDGDDLQCSHCNHQIRENCEGCSKIIDIGWRYCPYCGHVKAKEQE
jgi:RNA polymerase subunit RPABC4/transcription elongation factor Spt4